MAAAALVVFGAAGVLRSRAEEPLEPCADERDPRCTGAESSGADEPADGGSLRLTAAEACRNVGYLCAGLDRERSIQLRRWKDFSGTIVVRVPRPDFEAAGDGIALQQAAAIGLRAWNGQPFEIYTDTRGDREAHFEVHWSQTLGGSQIGVARTQWSAPTGLRVLAIELSTRNPFDPSRLNDPRQVRLTAAHEMGHALGLGHSNATRDVMFPTNTATSISAQDYRTMESLYALPDGTEIVR